MSNEKGCLLDDEESYVKLGIDPGIREPWEDGLRLTKPFKPGEWEWWYCDAHFTNGYFCVTSFHLETDEQGRVTPFLNVNITKDNAVICDLKGVQIDEYSASEGGCDVTFGKNLFRSLDGLKRYHVFVHPDSTGGFGLDLSFDSTVPAYRPGTGRWDAGGRHFSWFCAVPGASVSGQLSIKGESIEVEGNGYHDHNWGNVPMDEILSDWLWGRAEVGDITVVSASVRFRPEVGGDEAPLLYAARGQDVLIDAFNDAVVCLEGVKVPQPVTGKRTSSDCIFIAQTDRLKASVRFDGQRTVIASFQWANSSPDWETWYTRFPAKVTIDIQDRDGTRILATDSGPLENMDFFGRRLA
ncbi:carotenoid 1,2-hydratase (plasmid) [Rhizobium sp. NIBRBAC000502774]|nr:carotenoid 1,2-hydratase [Rhizobium sp. NIBRBAC000502774]